MENKDNFDLEFGNVIIPMISVVGKGQLPDGNEPVSAKEIKKGGSNRLLPKTPLNVDGLIATGCKNIPGSIGEGEEERKQISKEYRTRYKEGDKSAVGKLLERDPRFILEP
jgi:hypothetical protein